MTRKDKKAQTREALRAAALRCFQRSGYVETSIADITQEADVAKGTFYVHFEDKAALLDELLLEFNEALAARLRADLTQVLGAELPVLVRALASSFLEHWLANAHFVRIYAERSATGLDVTALPFGLNPQTRDVLQLALVARAGGKPLPVDAELAVHGIVAMWLRLGLQLVFRPELEQGPVVETLVVLTTGALEGIYREA